MEKKILIGIFLCIVICLGTTTLFFLFESIKWRTISVLLCENSNSLINLTNKQSMILNRVANGHLKNITFIKCPSKLNGFRWGLDFNED